MRVPGLLVGRCLSTDGRESSHVIVERRESPTGHIPVP